MRIYTRTGDRGTTSLIYGKRVPKNDPRVEAYGTCDELNSMIGLALSFLKETDMEAKNEIFQILRRIQTILFHVGSELSTPKGRKVHWKLEERHVLELEEKIDQWDAQLPTLNQFILPSGHKIGSTLHVARTIARRAERACVEFVDEIENPFVLQYLNRLSDFLFVAARYINHQLNQHETPLSIEDL